MSAAQTGSAPSAYVLNLDAELELAAGPGYRATRRTEAIVTAQAARLAPRLLGPRDVLLTPAGPCDRHVRPLDAEAAAGLPGRAWSPTPGALARLRAHGAAAPAHPSFECLQTVNARAFTAALHTAAELDGNRKHTVRDLDAALAQLAQASPLGWLVRRPFGAAGRGRRRIHAGAPDPGERAWLAASLAQGPLVIERFVEVAAETTRCALLARDGSLRIAAPGLQRTTPQGAWVETIAAPPADLTDADDARLLAALELGGRRLHRAGYFGPFGIDAFWYRDGGRLRLQPVSEINARLTMDWELSAHPDLAALAP